MDYHEFRVFVTLLALYQNSYPPIVVPTTPFSGIDPEATNEDVKSIMTPILVQQKPDLPIIFLSDLNLQEISCMNIALLTQALIIKIWEMLHKE